MEIEKITAHTAKLPTAKPPTPPNCPPPNLPLPNRPHCQTAHTAKASQYPCHSPAYASQYPLPQPCVSQSIRPTYCSKSWYHNILGFIVKNEQKSCVFILYNLTLFCICDIWPLNEFLFIGFHHPKSVFWKTEGGRLRFGYASLRLRSAAAPVFRKQILVMAKPKNKKYHSRIIYTKQKKIRYAHKNKKIHALISQKP